MKMNYLMSAKKIILLPLALAGLLGGATEASAAISLSSDVMLNGGAPSSVFTHGSTNATGIEIVRNWNPGNHPANAVPYTVNNVGPTIDLTNYGTEYNQLVNSFGANMHGRGSTLFAPGDGETLVSNNGGIGFGGHSPWLITFDLNEIRTSHLGESASNLRLTGRYALNGHGAPGEVVPTVGFGINIFTKGAIFLDGVEVYESPFQAVDMPSSFFDLTLNSSDRYLTFVISGGSEGYWYTDGTFRDVSLVPEPSAISVLGLAFVVALLRRRRS